MFNKKFYSASGLLSLCFILAITSGCSKNEKSAPAASPSPTVNSSTSTTAGNNTASNSSQLTFQKAVFIKKGADNKAIPVEDGIYKRGEEVVLVLVNVGKFKKGSDGKNWLDMDMLVKNPQGKVIFAKQSLLGDKGKVVLKDDIAPFPNGTINTSSKVAPGVYQLTLTVYDKIGGNQVSETKSFTLK